MPAVGDWVLVEYEGNLYPGETLESTKEYVTVSAMEPIEFSALGSRMWRWPRTKDVHKYPVLDVIRTIHPPVPTGKRASQFIFNEKF